MLEQRKPRTNWKDLSLWGHQIDAVKMLEKYFSSESEGSALVRMPTGAGKTRVIAVVTRCLPSINTSLVVCPFRGLSDQLARDLASDPKKNNDPDNEIWCEQLNESWPRRVIPLKPSTLQRTLEKVSNDPRAVLVSTIQALEQIHAKDPDGYESLRKRLDAVIFDEGHREPAPEWAYAIRGLGKPSVLVTATPYRNDQQMFAVDKNYIYVFPHHLATEERFIRAVQMDELLLPTDPQAFVDQLLLYYNKKFATQKPEGVEHPRVIIRCETERSVDNICKALKRRGESFLGLHDRFGNEEEEGRLKRVPDSRKQTQTFWVHQFKLLEGIDNPAFCMLAIYEPLRNARSLVQQVGRVIRNKKLAKNQTAYVLVRTGDRQKNYWDKYLLYERDYEKNPQLYDLRQLFDTFVDIQAGFQYYDGDFRAIFGIESPNVHEKYVYRPSAAVLKFTPNASWTSLVEALEQEWKSGDRDVRNRTDPDSDTVVLTYVIAGNSPVLYETALTEMHLGFCVLRRSGNYLFFTDSAGGSSRSLEAHCERVEPDRLEGLFSGAGSKISYISLLNSDLGSQSLRRRALGAASLQNTAPGLSDHGYFPSSVVGTGGNVPGRRYVGLTRARISDRTRRTFLYADYCAWTDSIAKELDRRHRAVRLFTRYAKNSAPPEQTDPVNILLDISDVIDYFALYDDGGRKHGLAAALEIEDVCLKVKNGIFELKANKTVYSVEIVYEPKRKRYLLDCPALKNFEANLTPDRPEDLIHYLNRAQAFRIVPESLDTIFAWGRFYRPRNPLIGPKSAARIELSHILNPVQELNDRTSEKGRPGSAKAAGWSPTSLFHLVDTRGAGTGLRAQFEGIDLLICDDLGTEAADFIAADTRRRRVVFIHAKVSGSLLSASALQDVCGQATKNLGLLSPYNQSKPPNLSRWDGPWEGGRIGTVSRRIRMGGGTKKSAALWGGLQTLLRDPSTRREIWILLGDTLSRRAFERSRQSSTPTPETIQILFLLQSTWANVSSVGAELKVFCSP